MGIINTPYMRELGTGNIHKSREVLSHDDDDDHHHPFPHSF